MTTKRKTSKRRRGPAQLPARAERARVPGKPKVATAHLELESPGARCVELAGTFNNWQPRQDRMRRREDGRWVKDLSLKAGKYEYRFVVDGRWIADPNAERNVANEFGESNSVLVVPAADHQGGLEPGRAR